MKINKEQLCSCPMSMFHTCKKYNVLRTIVPDAFFSKINFEAKQIRQWIFRSFANGLNSKYAKSSNAAWNTAVFRTSYPCYKNAVIHIVCDCISCVVSIVCGLPIVVIEMGSVCVRLCSSARCSANTNWNQNVQKINQKNTCGFEQ